MQFMWFNSLKSQHFEVQRYKIMESSEIIGFIAAILTTIAFIPQAYHSWHTRDLSGISLPMYSLFSTGVLFWLIYGVMIGSWPIMIANTITLILASVVLCLKIKSNSAKATE